MPPGIGRQLHEARTRRGIGLEEVERVTKIRRRYLSAIEDERWADLPGDAYARGFLATYARYLGLDERPLLAQYQAGAPVSEPEPIPETMLPQPGEHGTRMPRSVLVGLPLVLVAGIAVAVALALSGGDDEGAPQTGAERAPMEPRATQTTTTETTTATETETQTRPELALRATGPVWVCLVDRQGRALVAGETLAEGEERGPFAGRAFELNLGNGAIRITLDGERVEIPEAAEPLGYRISDRGVEELAEGERPTCA